jgi:energy-coupling factor transporter ATP-binding protein EcfA2
MFRSCVVAASTTKLAVKLRALTNSRPNFADPSHLLKSGGWKEKFVNLKEKRFFIFAGAGVTAVAGSVYVLGAVARSGGVNDTISLFATKPDYLQELTYSLDKSVVKIPEDPGYVARGYHEGVLDSAKRLAPKGYYYVIYGPKGAGKSKLTTHVAKDREATIQVTVTTASKQEDILSALSKKLLGKVTLQSPVLDVDTFVRAVDNCENTPLIVFDVETSDTKDRRVLLGAVRGVCKALAHKCICWIVLSEANAVLTFGMDSYREKFIYVGEMNKEEARKFVNKELNLPVDGKKMLTAADNELIEIDDKDFEYVYNTIGGTPAMLILLAEALKAKTSVQDFVASQVATATQDLVAFTHKPILKALKKKPDGVSPEFFKNQVHEGVDLSVPADVGLAMKKSNAIVYRQELNEYQLMSTAHRTALKAYDPLVT